MKWQRLILNGNTKNKQLDLSFAFAVILRCCRCCFTEGGYEMYKGLLNTLVQPLFCSLNLFSMVLIDVVVSPRLCPHYAGEIWKRSFISTAWLTVHTNSSRKRVLSKTLLKPEEFENAGLAFSRVRKTFWKRSFSKTMTSRSSRDYPERRFLKHKSKMAGVVGFLNSYGVVWTENIWCVKYPNNFSPSLRAWRVLTNAC